MAKNIPEGTRKFKGEKFTFVTTTHLKRVAKRFASNLREDGYKARTIPVTGGGISRYRVYKK